jgi:hypothetical protein
MANALLKDVFLVWGWHRLVERMWRKVDAWGCRAGDGAGG